MRGARALCCLALVACDGPREAVPDLETRRRAARRAVEALSAAPQRARRLEADLERAERLLRGGAPSASARRAWARVAMEAGRALHERARERRRLEGYRRLEADARRALARAESSLEGTGAGRLDAAALGRARLALEVGARLAREGSLEAATASVARVAALLEPIRRRLAQVRVRYADPELLALWRGWVEETVAQSRRTARPVLVVDKLGHRLLVVSGGRVVREIPAELGTNGLADKLVEGDRATPEGRYRVVERKAAPRTSYHRALLLDYPNEADRRRFVAAAVAGRLPGGAGPGGLIEIHGGGGRGGDWTDGCVALPDEEMEWVFERIGEGTPVTIVGTVRWP